MLMTSSRTVVIMNTMANDAYIRLQLNSTGSMWSGNVPMQSLVTWVLPSS